MVQTAIFAGDPHNPHKGKPDTKRATESELIERYSSLGIENLSFDAYERAVKGLEKYKTAATVSSNVVAIIDFDLPSTEKRLFLVDLGLNKVIYSTYVAHGRNSGDNYATKFSNKIGSYKSSLGFYKTAEKYVGKHGRSLRLDGLEKGVNDKARVRGIVVHSADYVSSDFISKYKRLGRSLGCPAIPKDGFKKVLNILDDNILLYIHSSRRN